MKLIEALFMESCEINYVQKCGTGLKVSINIMNNQWQLVILINLSTNGFSVYVATGKIIEGYTTLLCLYEDTDFLKQSLLEIIYTIVNIYI